MTGERVKHKSQIMKFPGCEITAKEFDWFSEFF